MKRRKESMSNSKEKNRGNFWTKIIAGILAGLMVLGTAAAILFTIFTQ